MRTEVEGLPAVGSNQNLQQSQIDYIASPK